MLFLVLLLVFSVHIYGEALFLNVTDNSESQKVFPPNTSHETLSEEASVSNSTLFPPFSYISYFNVNSRNVTQYQSISSNSLPSVTAPITIHSETIPFSRIFSFISRGTTPLYSSPLKMTFQELPFSEITKREVSADSTSPTKKPETTTEIIDLRTAISESSPPDTEPPEIPATDTQPEIPPSYIQSSVTPPPDIQPQVTQPTEISPPETQPTEVPPPDAQPTEITFPVTSSPESLTPDTTNPQNTNPDLTTLDSTITTFSISEITTQDSTIPDTTTLNYPTKKPDTTTEIIDLRTALSESSPPDTEPPEIPATHTTTLNYPTTPDTTTFNFTTTTPDTTMFNFTTTTPGTTTQFTTTPDTTTQFTTTHDTTTQFTTTPDTTTQFTTTHDTTTQFTTTHDTTTQFTTTPDTTTHNFTTTPDTTTLNYTTPSTTLNYTTTDISIPSTNLTETATSQTPHIPTTTDETTTTSEFPVSSGSPPPIGAEKDKSTAVLLGILIPVLVIGVIVILWMGYRSGRITWPPKYLSSDTPDNVRPSYIALKKLPAHCDQMLEVPSKLNSEFQFLKTLSDDIICTESFIAAQMLDNKVKNRYTNILPYDSTRVKLIPEGNDFFSDYINASYIKGYTNEIEYIATQGPKEETCRDFWRMIYQEPVKVIVMVTQFEEMGKPKCHKYFPNLRENMVLGDISIWCTTELHFPLYTSRTLVLTKDDRKRSITHLHFREWPDFGCPSSPDLMLQFCQVMRQHITIVQPGITVVHCSAGVGRTGTLIAVDILLQQINENKKISVFDTVYKLRKHRVSMVQSEAQYVYIYKCLKEALENPSYLVSENSSSSSMEPIYENIECTRMTPSSKIPAEVVTIESEFVF